MLFNLQKANNIMNFDILLDLKDSLFFNYIVSILHLLFWRKGNKSNFVSLLNPIKLDNVLFQLLVFCLSLGSQFLLSLYFRYDWYQTESQVIVTIMIKNAQKDDISVQFSEKEVIYIGY